jgi:hypothetical protein
MRDGSPNSRRQRSGTRADRFVRRIVEAQAHPALAGGPFLDVFSSAKRHIRHAGRLHREASFSAAGGPISAPADPVACPGVARLLQSPFEEFADERLGVSCR